MGLTREVVLGLLVECPGYCYQLDQRLQQHRFRAAEFVHGTAAQAITQLLKEGLAREQRSPNKLALAGRRNVKIYEATDRGVAHFREWIRMPARPMPIREELIARVSLCQPDDMPRLIEVVRNTEAMLMAQLQNLNFRDRVRHRALDRGIWETQIDVAVSKVDHAVLDSRIKWVQELHNHLVEEFTDPIVRSRSRSRQPA